MKQTAAPRWISPQHHMSTVGRDAGLEMNRSALQKDRPVPGKDRTSFFSDWNKQVPAAILRTSDCVPCNLLGASGAKARHGSRC